MIDLETSSQLRHLIRVLTEIPLHCPALLKPMLFMSLLRKRIIIWLATGAGRLVCQS